MEVINHSYSKTPGAVRVDRELELLAADGSQTVLDVIVDDLAFLAISAHVDVGGPLSAFSIIGNVTPDEIGGLTLASVAADYTSPSGVIVDASGDLTVLADQGWVLVNVTGFYRIRVEVTAGADINPLYIRATGKG